MKAKKKKGVAGKMFSYGFEMRESGFKQFELIHIRNLPMQKRLKSDFVRAGKSRKLPLERSEARRRKDRFSKKYCKQV